MKTQHTFLALCLLGAGTTFGQSTPTAPSTTTATYTSDSSRTTATDNGTLNTSTNTNSMNSSTNSAAPLNSTYSTTTTGNDRAARNGKRTDGKDGKFGIYAGVNFSRFVNEPLPDNTYRPGYQVGLYYRSPGTIFGQIGAEYRATSSNLIRTGTGSGTTPGTITDQLKGSLTQKFLTIPAYVGVRLGGTLGFRIQAGAELAAQVAVGENNFQLGNDDLNRTILNGLLGAGVNLGPVTIDAVYNQGFVNVFDDGADTKRTMLALNLGLRF
ncbi:MAG: outer membrane beta-barrel protein [Bacteroidetes bacterium]|nr:outer membrane beta-barrel protein [Fibrella sp.]